MDYRKPAAMAALALVAGCGTTTAHTTAAAKPAATTPAGCTHALQVLPSSPPATTQQAANEIVKIGVRQGTTLDAMLTQVGQDLGQLGEDAAGSGGDTTADVATFNHDVAAVRSYCR